MIQFPSRKEAEILIRVPAEGIDTATLADRCDLEGNDMWHRLDSLEQKGYLESKANPSPYPTQWRLSQMGEDMTAFILDYK